MRNAHAITAAVAAVMSALLLSACSTSPPPTSSAPNATEALSLSPVGDEAYRCLRALGWDVRIEWDGGVIADSTTVPTEQYEQYNADAERCWAAPQERVEKFTTEQIDAAYDAELATRLCLIDADVVVETPPSRQNYRDNFFGERWSAYGGASIDWSGLERAAWKRLNERCPQPAWAFGAQN